MLIKEYTRLDWADDKRKFNVVMDNVCFFAEHYPKGQSKPDTSKTAVAFTNGTVMLLDVPVASFKQALASYKK